MKTYKLVILILLSITLIRCSNESGTFKDSRDGQSYKWVKIGNQIWMAENLNYDSDNGSWVYDNNPLYAEIYGRLYNWETACKVCPDGWHLPTDAEWTILTDYIGGEDVAGGKMKEKGTMYWNSPNTEADNSSGFTGLPGGGRGSNDGSFGSLGYDGYLWSTTEYGESHAWLRSLYYGKADVFAEYGDKTFGYSVRCLKD
ncbi:MAG: fibrobacter succinogenes major paralogous domain-containing protein [Bacteroidota bacterium]